ncbi:GNAT family N-acetyltransferase [Pseudanabaena sp. lw0831]|uniref:GNAT family N-acetyltransferase n=1 Tax=Pseudanabaena sp. lw0831 TaxID=1357935 RepID=UPI001F173D9F|nr:N-acetyltransferase [Pseudanabaena sp. lw0831]
MIGLNIGHGDRRDLLSKGLFYLPKLMEIQDERPEDIDAIRTVNIAAFGRENEANLVDQLRGIDNTLSFVAIESEQIVGHIFFSPVTIDEKRSEELMILGLAPLAILPQYQRQGIGSLLIKHSLEKCSDLGCKAVVVLGYPEYYSRFGFISAKEKGLKCEYLVPDDLFMVLELKNSALDGCRGIVKYRFEFQECE